MYLKPPDETPAAVAKVIECFANAGVPEGVINLVYGVPQQLSAHLINSDVIRKISFTGSVGVGRELARLAAGGVKRSEVRLFPARDESFLGTGSPVAWKSAVSTLLLPIKIVLIGPLLPQTEMADLPPPFLVIGFALYWTVLALFAYYHLGKLKRP